MCVLVLDAADGVSRQYARIASIIADSYKAAVVAANKWDLIGGDDYGIQRFEDERDRRLGFLSYAPFLRMAFSILDLHQQRTLLDRRHQKTVVH